MSHFRESMLAVAQLCAQKKIADAVISPGSRSAPLTLSFARHPEITCHVVVDERSAAFVALGIAQQRRQPVVLICTSGTAALNYAPAVTEAFYQQIPLLVFTADRPPEWLNQHDGQTIMQRDLYQPHCNASFELPVDDGHPDAAWHLERTISEAVNATLWPVPGPVHINVPLREPLYPRQATAFPERVRQIDLLMPRLNLSEKAWDALADGWNSCERKLLVAGLHPPDPKLQAALKEVAADPGVVILPDVASNCCRDERLLFDALLGADQDWLAKDLTPELLVTFGGPVVSKNLKIFLRTFKPARHWHIEFNRRWPDTFQSLQTIIPMQPGEFFGELASRMTIKNAVRPGFRSAWQALDTRVAEMTDAFLRSERQCELAAMSEVLSHLPDPCNIHLGNSAIVRLASLLWRGSAKDIRMYSNRGTSGIDGTVSTAVGAALASSRPTTLIAGDLAFFYDSNALWHKHLPPNLRIVIFNNQGGGIFRVLDGSREQGELDDYFEAGHQRTAEHLAADYGLRYESCNMGDMSAQHLESLFYSGKGAAILEIHFEKTSNARSFLRYKSTLKELK